MKRTRILLGLLLFGALVFLLLPGKASSLPTCGMTWTNTAGGAWTDAANWDNGVPTTTTYACITASGDYTHQYRRSKALGTGAAAAPLS